VSDRAGEALILAMLLILPISALAARRLPARQLMGYGVAWAAVFAVGVLLVSSLT
jgi:hypothetical protein